MNTCTKTATHIVCPGCHQPAGTIDHLLGQAIDTMWYCASCGARYAFKLLVNGEVTDLRLTGDRKEKCLVLLRNGNVGLVVAGSVFTENGKLGDWDAHHTYYYDEHTCPTNFMRDVKAVLDLATQDADPHGIFHYVATLPWDARVEDCNNEDFLGTMFPAFKKDSQI